MDKSYIFKESIRLRPTPDGEFCNVVDGSGESIGKLSPEGKGFMKFHDYVHEVDEHGVFEDQMTVQELKDHKKQTEEEILNALTKFANESGIDIDEVQLTIQTRRKMNLESRKITKVHLILDI